MIVVTATPNDSEVKELLSPSKSTVIVPAADARARTAWPIKVPSGCAALLSHLNPSILASVMLNERPLAVYGVVFVFISLLGQYECRMRHYASPVDWTDGGLCRL